MSGKTSKKLQQFYRREVKGSFNIWSETVRDKHWLVPTFIYNFILWLVFKKDAVKIANKLKEK